MELKALTHHGLDQSDMECGRSAEQTHYSKTGEKIQFLVSLCLIDYWGRKAVVSINHDIRQRKRIEAAITASEKQMRSLVETISEIVALIDAQGTITFISPQVERVLGYPAEEIKGKNIFDFIHPDDRERAAAEYSKTIQDPGLAVPSMLRVRTRAGEWIPFEVIANNQLSDTEVAAVVFTARDLRYRREAEKAVREANADFEKRVEQRTMELAKANAALRIENQQRRYTETQLQQSLSLLHSTLESTEDGILVVSKDGRVSTCNHKFLDMWNIPQMAVVGLRWDADLRAIAITQIQDIDEFQAKVEELRQHPDAVSFDTIRFKDGRIFERCSQPQRIGDQIVGRVWSFHDVTHSREVEDELRQAQKMEAVGRLAGGMAHDFNNMLMLISGYAGQMLEDSRLPARHRVTAQQLVDATKRAAGLTRQLLAFSRKQPVMPRVLDLNRVVSDMQKLLQRLLSDRVQLVIHLQDEPVLVRADQSQIELMIMNLAINARDAMAEGGTLAMRTRTLALPDGGRTPASRMEYALLEVADTGHGMSPEIRKHIFEPFFTTKEPGRGTGLGLSTVYGIVEAADGHISVESEPERGATFRIYLPLATGVVSEEAQVQEAPPRSGHETILLVEDEGGIRSMTKVYLETLGYIVLEAGSSSEAERVSREYLGEIDLVVTDIVMPGKRGDEMLRDIRKKRPETAAVFISGFADVQDLDSSIPVLEKPFAFPGLGRQVRETLDQAQKQRAKPPIKQPSRKRA
jgi:PAS domain S-box-containing protein